MKTKQLLMMAALFLTSAITLTSCEGSLDDVFGEWDRPVPSTIVEDARVLGAAEAKGAIVTVTYTVGSTTYTAKFEKGDGDNYTLISNTKGTGAGARALTRTVADPVVKEGDASTVGKMIQLILEGGKLKLIVKDINDAPLFEAQFKIETGETVIINTNPLGVNCTIGNFAVNDEKKEIKNPEMQKVTINFTYSLPVPGSSPLDLKFDYAVQYNDGEKWSDVVARYKDSGHAEIGTYDDYISIQFDKDIAKEVIKEAASGSIDETTIDGLATTVSEIKLYLISNDPNALLTARAMTRMSAPNPTTYVKTTESVGSQTTYYLTTIAPVLTSDVGKVIALNRKIYVNATAASEAGTTAVAKIIYVGSSTGSENYNHGLALALENIGTDDGMSWDDANANNGGKTAIQLCNAWNTSKPVEGALWMLPSKDQWNTMIDAAGSYSDLSNGFNSVGGTDMSTAHLAYWSSTESTGNFAWAFGFGDWLGGHEWLDAQKDTNTYSIRACLVF